MSTRVRRFSGALLLRQLLALTLACLAARAYAAIDGSLDPGFGAVTIQTPRPASLNFSTSALQPDGKLLLLGVGSTADAGCPQRTSTAIARLNADGSLDTSFGDSLSPGRTVLLGFCQESLDLRAIALQPDGRILLGGGRGYANGRLEAIVIRLNPEGSIDTSFASAGLFTLSRPLALAPSDRVDSLAILAGEPLRIVAAGVASDSGGIASLAFALDAQGVPIGAGNHQDAGGPRYRRESLQRPGNLPCLNQFLRLQALPAGSLTYAVALTLCQPAPGAEYDYSMNLYRFDALGNGPAERVAFAFDPQVQLDAHGFMPPRTVVIPFAMDIDVAAGRVWAAGLQFVPNGPIRSGVAAVDFGLQPDTRVLGGDGRHLVGINDFAATGLVVQPDGRLVLAGKLVSVNQWIGVHRLHAATGAPDTSFGPEVPSLAILPTATPNPVAFGLHRQTGSGRLLVAAATNTGADSGQLAAFGLIGNDALLASGFE